MGIKTTKALIEGRGISKTETLTVVPVWIVNKYDLSFKEKSCSFDSGDGWAANAEDFPNGTVITIETHVSISIPANPLPIPEWKSLDSFYNRYTSHGLPPIYTLPDVTISDGDAVVLCKDLLLVEKIMKSSYRDTKAYRVLKQEDMDTVKQMFPKLHKGQRVSIRRQKALDYHQYQWGWEEEQATIIDFPQWHTARVITTTGTERTVYKGFVTIDEQVQS